MNKKFYITTAIPYVNAAPQIGFALEAIQADTLARYQRLLGKDVFFLTGSDENSLKNVQAAEEKGVSVEQLVKENSDKFYQLKEALNLSFDDFIRTTEERHIKGAQAFWQACKKTDIYKKKYKGLYCVGCETFYTEKDLVDGKCPEHQCPPEIVEEENYFFRLSAYQKWLEELIEKDKLKIIPEIRKNEVLAFIKRGLEDFSISRSVKRAHGWGIPVPNDKNQIQFVWFDALTNYITALDWQNNGPLFQKYWPADVHVIGKGISRFHAIYWPAMLKSAGLTLPKEIFIHGYITINRQKISKSLGNIIDPFNLVKKYGTDPIRYYLLKEIPAYDDGDFSEKRFREVYNADLANGLGNLTARVAKLCERANSPIKRRHYEISSRVKSALEQYRFDEALEEVWLHIDASNHAINKTKAWQLHGKELERSLETLVSFIDALIPDLQPFLPETAKKIKKQFQGPKIKSGAPLFPRLK
ncbi:methionine--tRNA ligase [Microgenomates group bacterium RBG_19FT_COMBO_39_10]|nr:MAG: methionine--tRNA ligase [Microgenomates group bacterium RBG_19FT_COMBO_39_10]